MNTVKQGVSNSFSVVGRIYALRFYAGQTILHTMIQPIFSLLSIHGTATRRNLIFFGSNKHANVWYQRLSGRNF